MDDSEARIKTGAAIDTAANDSDRRDVATEHSGDENSADESSADENNGGDASTLQDSNAPLFRKEKCQELDNDWQEIQVSFVDEPRAAVEKADALVKRTIDNLAASFSDIRASLETSWERDKEISTEDLRRALQSYRSFFKRLLSV